MKNAGIIIVAAVGITLTAQLYVQFFKLRRRGIPGLDDCLRLIICAAVLMGLTLLALLLPETGGFSLLIALIDSFTVLTYGFGTMIVIVLMGGIELPLFTWFRRLWVVPVSLLLLLACTNPWNGLVIKEAHKLSDGFGYVFTRGPIGLFITVVFAGMLLFITSYAVHAVRRSPLRSKKMLLLLLATALIPVTGGILELAVPFLLHVQFNNLLLWGPIVMLMRVFYGYLLTSRNMAVADTNEVYVVFDMLGNCVDTNAAADTFLAQYCGTNRPLLQELGKVVDVQLESITATSKSEFERTVGGERKYYQVRAFSLSNSIARRSGSGFLIRETTEFREQMNMLSTLASEDPLTGVKNRRFFEEYAAALLKRRKGSSIPITLLMIDNDHFKNINDTYGHSVGDEVLVELCERCVQVLRPIDLLCRYGGEEFAVLVEGMDGDSGRDLAERIRKVIGDRLFKTSAGEVSVKVSVGGCTMPANAHADIRGWIMRADEMLYQAKRTGRNRVAYVADMPKIDHP